MKDIVSINKPLGSDGGAVVAGVSITDSAMIRASVSVDYPLAKVLEPAEAALDKALDNLKVAIPGPWDDAVIDGFKAEYKAELVKLLAAPAASV